MTRLQRPGAVLVVLGLCVALAGGGVAAVGASEHLSDNETQHEHPDEVREDGDLAGVQSWLGDRMTEVHIDCAEDLSAGERVACNRLDEEYPDYLEQYADVEREQTGENDTADTFRQAREEQEELAEERTAFNETLQEYEAARAEGDDERARRLARDLATRAERIEELGGSLNTLFARLDADTGRDYSRAQRLTNETTAEVSRLSIEVQETEFTPASMTASVDATTATFSDPVEVRGRLTAQNGSALADRDLLVTVDNRPVATTETDSTGRYEATYRPVTTTTGPTNVTVWYEPTGADPYLGSNASAAVAVEAVSASVFLDVEDDRVAFGDTLTASTRVAVTLEAAPGVPVTMRLEDEALASGQTDENGSVTLTGPVSATVPEGDRMVSVRVSRNGTAIEPAVANGTVTVEPSDSSLTLDGLLDGEELVLTGRLTANGEPVSGQRVGVNVDGATRKMARTDEDGEYEVRVPRDTGGPGVWSVTADYENPETNLRPTNTTRTLQTDDLEATNGTDTSTSALGELRQLAASSGFLRSLSDEELLVLTGGVLGVVVLAIGGVVLLVRRRRDEAPDGMGEAVPPAVVDAGDGEQGNGPPDDGPSPEPSPDTLDAPAVLDVARERLGEGSPNEAVRIGYGAVRRQLAAVDADGTEDARTHWEFYRAVEPELDEDRAEALERLTIAYQRAAFAPDGTGTGTARAALNAAETCLSPAPDGRPRDLA